MKKRKALKTIKHFLFGAWFMFTVALCGVIYSAKITGVKTELATVEHTQVSNAPTQDQVERKQASLRNPNVPALFVEDVDQY